MTSTPEKETWWRFPDGSLLYYNDRNAWLLSVTVTVGEAEQIRAQGRAAKDWIDVNFMKYIRNLEITPEEARHILWRARPADVLLGRIYCTVVPWSPL